MPFPAHAPAARTDLGEDGEVMTLFGQPRGLRPRTVVSTLPEPRDAGGRRVGKDARPIDDPRGLRCGEGHPDHIDAEERGVLVFVGLQIGASLELLARPHRARARIVDVQDRLVVRVGDQGNVYATPGRSARQPPASGYAGR